MQAIEAVRTALKFSDMGMTYLGEMRDRPLLRPGPWGGNHAMWIAGHLAVVEGRLHQMLHGVENPPAAWKPLFDWGSEPAEYPAFDEVMAKLKELRGRTHAFLDQHGEAGLDFPTKCQPPRFTGMETAGKAILVIAVHASGHLGRLNVVRAAGKPRPLVSSAEPRAF